MTDPGLCGWELFKEDNSGVGSAREKPLEQALVLPHLGTQVVSWLFPGLSEQQCEKHGPGKSWSGVLVPWGSQGGKVELPEGQIPKVCTELTC